MFCVLFWWFLTIILGCAFYVLCEYVVIGDL
jgi:hypothetical protein